MLRLISGTLPAPIKKEPERETTGTRDFMYRLVENDVDLWANLGWERGGKELWDYIKDIPGLEILSAPMAEGSKVGKRMWVERELGVPVEKVNLSDSKKPYRSLERKTRTSD